MRKSKVISVSIRLLWILLIALSIIGYISELAVYKQTNSISSTVIFALIILTIGWIFIFIRVFRFFSRMRAFLKRLLDNDYSTGIRKVPWLDDEISSLTDLANKTAAQLQIYDELRADNTRLSYKGMDLMFRNSEQCIIIADMAKKQFRFNPAMQELYSVKQETFSFDIIEKQVANTQFFKMFLTATLRDEITKEGTTELQLPQRETCRRLNFRLEPLKDKHEKVRLAFIFIVPVSDSDTQ